MGTTTFSGPIKAGTIKDTTGTTVGTNVANVGQVVMAQTFSTVIALDDGPSAANSTDVVIPANSQIIDIAIDVVGAVTGATCVFSIGDVSGGDATFLNSFGLPNGSLGRRYPQQQAGGTRAWADTGANDLRLTWTSTGDTTDGEIRATVLYQQNNNLTA